MQVTLLRSFGGSLLLSLAVACSADSTPVAEDDDEVVAPDARVRANKKDAGASATEDEGDDDAQEQDPPQDDDDVSAKLDGGAKRDAASALRDAAVEVAADASESPAELAPFSFFVTSLKAMRELAGNQNGFGGDLRFGETGEGAGLRGADKICTTIAEKSMPGAGKKMWRAFLSTTKGGADGGPVHAIDRIGEGPWYDRIGRVVSKNKADLLNTRPASADALIKNDLPNEDGVPNLDPDGTGPVDNHDILTGSNAQGQLYRNDVRVTCADWTKSTPDRNDAPRVGHSWPRSAVPIGGVRLPTFPGADGGTSFPGFPGGGGLDPDHWISSLDEAGCGPGVSIVERGAPQESNPTVGSGGGYGGIYCFALEP